MKQFFKQNIKPRLGLVALLLLCSSGMYAQTTDGIYIDSAFTVKSGDTLRWYGNVEIAPNAKVTIEDGAKILFYGDTLKVNPGAQILGTAAAWSSFTPGLGTGSIVFQKSNPNTGSTNQQVLIGGNSGSTTANTFVAIEINNANGVKLMGSNTRIGSSLTFTSGHLYVDVQNLVMSSVATIAGADAGKFAVTASTGTVAKEGLATAAFAFPVGSSDVPGDYLPAVMQNSGTADQYNVRAISPLTPAPGSNASAYLTRSWQIAETTPGGSNVILGLQHNTATNQGTTYVDATAQILSSPATANWKAASASATTQAAGTVAGSSAHTVAAITDFSTNTYFTKGLAVSGVVVSAKVLLQGAMSGTAMTTKLNAPTIMPTAQPYNKAPFNYAGTESVPSIPAGVTDWVLVELRDANTPSTVVATRAAFVKSDGSVVDLDGSSVVSFSTATAGNYYIAIRHRNHLGIRSANTQALSSTATLYDFTSGEAQAYQDLAITTNPAMKDLGNGLFAMWGGNGANTGGGATNVRATGAAVVNDYQFILTVLNGATSVPGYSNADYNMDGTVRATGAAVVNDYTFLLNVLGINTAISQHQ